MNSTILFRSNRGIWVLGKVSNGNVYYLDVIASIWVRSSWPMRLIMDKKSGVIMEWV